MKIIRCIAEKNNIVIGNRTLKFNDEMLVDDITIDGIKGLINAGYIVVEESINEPAIVRHSEVKIKSVPITKEELIEIMFKFHTCSELTQNELKKLMWFYKTIHPINNLDKSVKDDMDNINNHEELIEILINQIYPLLIDNYLKS